MNFTTTEPAQTAIDKAKRSIASLHQLSDWSRNAAKLIPISIQDKVVHVGASTFQDNTQRLPASNFVECHGDTLPTVPAVLIGACEHWGAFSLPNCSWSVENLAARTTARLSLDGGPSFARMSICRGKVTMQEYQAYCGDNADDDAAPLYIFDPDILTGSFVNGALVQDDYDVPSCFSSDVMACLTGSRFRPLPPAWLLVGVTRSGTPIHDHPLTVAWNALLVGCKLWCCLPPDVDQSLLLLNLDYDDDKEFDKSAIDWFQQIGDLPKEANIIVQRPGEIVFLPTGWFHVVLNVETSTAISVSLTLRRDLLRVWPLLVAEDVEFARGWLQGLEKSTGNGDDTGVSLEDMSTMAALLVEKEAEDGAGE